ncbi:MAG: glycosyltransferase family 39 protein [Chloroflexi bacterium]|nr:glycosyltransferase family 39 protein [Chloroflexota bacterium]
MKSRYQVSIGVLILLTASFLRLWMYGEVPPGLQHDETFNAEDAIGLVDEGNFRIFYESNQGREGAFIWLLGLSYLMFGINSLMIKFPAFVCGLFTVALTYRFGSQNFSRLVGFVASAMTAVSFWAIFTSRVGLRAVMLPVIVLLVLIGMSRILGAQRAPNRRRSVVLTGLALGFAFYTYTASLALIPAYCLFVATIAVSNRSLIRRIWLDLVLVAVIATALALPMAYVVLHQQSLRRAEGIAQPLRLAIDGNPEQLLDNAKLLIGMPAFVGDPLWRYNVAGRPLFLLPIGLLVYIGLAAALVRARQSPLIVFLIGLLLFGLVPSLVTIRAPSFLRTIAILPSVMLFVGIAVWQLCMLNKRRPYLGWSLGILSVAVTGIADYHAYFVEWTTSSRTEIPFHHFGEQERLPYRIYRNDLRILAQYLRDINEEIVFVSVPNQELDPIVYKYANGPSSEDLHVVWFDGLFNIALSPQPTHLFVSPLSPINSKHAHWLTEQFGTKHMGRIMREDGHLAFEIYQLGNRSGYLGEALSSASAHPVYIKSEAGSQLMSLPLQFGDLLRLHGIELPRQTVYGENDGINNQLYFEALRPTGASIQIFMHLVDQAGSVVAQRDYLGVPPEHWHPGLFFMQDHFVPFLDRIEAGEFTLKLGIYDWRSGRRIPVVNGANQPIADSLHVAEIEIRDRP